MNKHHIVWLLGLVVIGLLLLAMEWSYLSKREPTPEPTYDIEIYVYGYSYHDGNNVTMMVFIDDCNESINGYAPLFNGTFHDVTPPVAIWFMFYVSEFEHPECWVWAPMNQSYDSDNPTMRRCVSEDGWIDYTFLYSKVSINE